MGFVDIFSFTDKVTVTSQVTVTCLLYCNVCLLLIINLLFNIF